MVEDGVARFLASSMIQFDPSAFAICFVFTTLIIGYGVSFVVSRSGSLEHFLPPHSLCMFCIGIATSIGAQQALAAYPDSSQINTSQSWQYVLEISLELVGRIDASVIVYSFLPALLFGEAMTLNFHQALRAMNASVLLAFPGAVAGAWALGQFLYATGGTTLGYAWSFNLCFIVGTILAATDPVSVVATLKEISQSSPSALKLTYLITGEALLNDGSALVRWNAVPCHLDHRAPRLYTPIWTRLT